MLDSNNKIQFGTVQTNKLVRQPNFETVSIGPFPDTPIVLTSTNTFNGIDPITPRTTSITDKSFKVAMQEEESRMAGGHKFETIGFVATNKGTYTSSSGQKIERQVKSGISHQSRTFSFTNTFSSIPLFIVKLSSFAGPDTANIRVRNITNTQFTVFVQEEKSLDNEILHRSEMINYMAIGN